MTVRAVTFGGFAVVAVATVTWALLSARDARWASLPEVWDALRRQRPVRVALVLAWIWLGWHLFARGSGAFE